MNTNQTMKVLYRILEPSNKSDRFGRWFDWFFIILIVLNVFTIIAESFEDISIKFDIYFRIFELFSVIIFTLEFLMRIIIAPLIYTDQKPIKARIKYMFTFMALIDLGAILPFYLPFITGVDLRFLRIFRLTRIFRLFKVQRYNSSLQLIGRVMNSKKQDLLVTTFLSSLLILTASTLMYYIEGPIQPEAFPNIISALWWSVATLTTVGYGDVYPITGLGRLLAGVIAILGIGLVALPTGLISSGFIEAISSEKQSKSTIKCPHCGKVIIEEGVHDEV